MSCNYIFYNLKVGDNLHNEKVLNELIAKYRENKLAHAYLVETNNIEKAFKDIKEIIKLFNCEKEFESSCTKCNLCNLIDKNNLPSLKIISPDGSSIKKSQIAELKKDFNSIPIYSKYNVYIFLNAEKKSYSCCPRSWNKGGGTLWKPETTQFLKMNKRLLLHLVNLWGC